jgi:trans-aconitate methyltransferase
MGDRQDFFDKYDLMMPKFCKPYVRFLKIGARAVPESVKSIYDLGIGTGNFSAEVKKKVPEVKIYGIDLDVKQLEKARLKLRDAELYCCDIFSRPFPKVDCIISSMVTHHFKTEKRKEQLIEIARNSWLFVNFDMVLFPGYDFERTINKISEFTKKNFLLEDALEIEKEMKERDNPMPLEEKINLFESNNFDFKILAQEIPYIVYRVSENKKL